MLKLSNIIYIEYNLIPSSTRYICNCKTYFWFWCCQCFGSFRAALRAILRREQLVWRPPLEKSSQTADRRRDQTPYLSPYSSTNNNFFINITTKLSKIAQQFIKSIDGYLRDIKLTLSHTGDMTLFDKFEFDNN